jgi:hypothetical protein
MDMMPPRIAEDKIFTPLLMWWRSIEKAEKRTPSRNDLKPEDLPASVFPYLLFCEFVDGYDDIVFRIVGDHIRKRASQDWRGRRGSEMADIDHFRDYLRPLYQAVAHQRRPVRTLIRLDRGDNPHYVVSRLLLPLVASDAVGELKFILSAICFNPTDSVSSMINAQTQREDGWRRVVQTHEFERVNL